jgi:hypothetical protein
LSAGTENVLDIIDDLSQSLDALDTPVLESTAYKSATDGARMVEESSNGEGALARALLAKANGISARLDGVEAEEMWNGGDDC